MSNDASLSSPARLSELQSSRRGGHIEARTSDASTSSSTRMNGEASGSSSHQAGGSDRRRSDASLDPNVHSTPSASGVGASVDPTRSRTGQNHESRSAWLRSIDSVYDLFEDESIRRTWPDLAAKVESGVRLCEEVLDHYGPDQVALSFNGGKDCTVVVHILTAVVRRRMGLSRPPDLAPGSNRTPQADSSDREGPQVVPSISSVYITCPSPFPSLEKFVEASKSPERYNLALIKVPGGMKEGLTKYLAGEGEEVAFNGTKEPTRTRRPRDVKAIFVGTRRTDPMGASLDSRARTDLGWPDVERIHPILDWGYEDVWTFLRCPILGSYPPGRRITTYMSADEVDKLQGLEEAEQIRTGSAGGGCRGVPYCVLYEQGYTSLGSTFNTLPNPELKASEVLRPSTGDGSKSLSLAASANGLDTVGDGTAIGRWKPAYALKDGSLERAGRLKGSTPVSVP